jgi:hypothetical protein
MLLRWADAQTFGRNGLAFGVRSVDIENEIARLLRDFVPQLNIEFQSDHLRPSSQQRKVSSLAHQEVVHGREISSWSNASMNLSRGTGKPLGEYWALLRQI